MPGATQDRARPVRRWIRDEPGILQPPREFGQGDLRLDPGQRSAETVVDTAAEAEMFVVPPVGVEPVRVGYVVGVTTAGGQHEDDRRAAWNGGTGDVDVVERGPVGQELDRWFVA